MFLVLIYGNISQVSPMEHMHLFQSLCSAMDMVTVILISNYSDSGSSKYGVLRMHWTSGAPAPGGGQELGGSGGGHMCKRYVSHNHRGSVTAGRASQHSHTNTTSHSATKKQNLRFLAETRYDLIIRISIYIYSLFGYVGIYACKLVLELDSNS